MRSFISSPPIARGVKLTERANFNALAAAAPGKYRFYAVSSVPLGSLRTYAQKEKINVPLYHVLSESLDSYGFEGTPSTLLVSPTGLTLARWEGAYTPSTTLDVENALSVHLPGISLGKPDPAGTE